MAKGHDRCRPQPEKLVLLCDGGIRVEPFKQGYLIDLSRIRERASSIAPIALSFMFDYQDGLYEHRIRNLYDENFFYITCPRIQEAQKNKDKTDWVLIDRALYDSCLDPSDYRPKEKVK